MSGPSVETAVRALADREAIRELAGRYANSVRQKDATGVADVFADGGVMDMGDRPAPFGEA